MRRTEKRWQNALLITLLRRWVSQARGDTISHQTLNRLQAHDNLEAYVAEQSGEPDFLAWHLQEVQAAVKLQQESAGEYQRRAGLRHLNLALRRYSRQQEAVAVDLWRAGSTRASQSKLRCLETLAMLTVSRLARYALNLLLGWYKRAQDDKSQYQHACEWQEFTVRTHEHRWGAACTQILRWIHRNNALFSKALIIAWSDKVDGSMRAGAIMRRVGGRWRHQESYRVFRDWGDNMREMAEQKRAQAILRRVAGRWKNTELSNCYRNWSSRTRENLIRMWKDRADEVSGDLTATEIRQVMPNECLFGHSFMLAEEGRARIARTANGKSFSNFEACTVATIRA